MSSSFSDSKLQYADSLSPSQVDEKASRSEFRFKIQLQKEEKKRGNPYQFHGKRKREAGTFLTAPRLTSEEHLDIRCYGPSSYGAKLWCVVDVMKYVCGTGKDGGARTLEDIGFPKEHIMAFKEATKEGVPRGGPFGVINDKGMQALHQCLLAKSKSDPWSRWTGRVEKINALMNINWTFLP